MSVLAPPPQDEPELLIPEARARQRKRWLAAAAVVAVLAGGALGLSSLFAGGGTPSASNTGGPAPAVRTVNACGVRGAGTRILDQSGRTLYREPGHYTHPNAGVPTIRCSGSTIWAVWVNGAAMSQEAYVGARSLDGGRSWELVFTEGMFGPKAPHELDAYFGVWTLHGPRDAYFTGTCPACGLGTVSLWVTKDAGRTFRKYAVPSLTGYAPSRVRVAGNEVTITAKLFNVDAGSRHRKTAAVRVS